MAMPNGIIYARSCCCFSAAICEGQRAHLIKVAAPRRRDPCAHVKRARTHAHNTFCGDLVGVCTIPYQTFARKLNHSNANAGPSTVRPSREHNRAHTERIIIFAQVHRTGHGNPLWSPRKRFYSESSAVVCCWCGILKSKEMCASR